MNEGLMRSLSLYPIKHFIDLFEPYGSSLETNILAMLMSYILNTFFSLKFTFLNLFIVKIYVLVIHSYFIPGEKEFKKCNNFVVKVLILYFNDGLNQ